MTKHIDCPHLLQTKKCEPTDDICLYLTDREKRFQCFKYAWWACKPEFRVIPIGG